MITLIEAAAIATKAANKAYNQPGDELVVIPEATMQKSYGWVFFFDSRRQRDNKDVDYELVGASPILVLAEKGNTVFLGTSRPANELLARWESQQL